MDYDPINLLLFRVLLYLFSFLLVCTIVLKGFSINIPAIIYSHIIIRLSI